jgi:hypothetical protein
MTPREAASALIGALPTDLSPSQLEEYGIQSTVEQAQAIAREVLALNLFWIAAAIKAHIPQKYQAAVSDLVLEAVESRWSIVNAASSMAWNDFLSEWKERSGRYERLLQEGASPLALTTEVGMRLEEHGVVTEEDRRKLLGLLIDYVPVDTYGQLLENVG